MATSVVEIWNMALGHLNADTTVQSEVENSNEAEHCALYWATVRDTVFGSIQWNFAKRASTLALTTNTPTGWDYEYTAPSDMVVARHIYNPLDPTNSKLDPIPFEVGHNGTTTVIWCNEGSPTLWYTARITTVALYPPAFNLAASFLLAHFIAPKLAKEELAQKMLSEYQVHLNLAGRIDQNQGFVKNEVEAEWTTARG